MIRSWGREWQCPQKIQTRPSVGRIRKNSCKKKLLNSPLLPNKHIYTPVFSQHFSSNLIERYIGWPASPLVRALDMIKWVKGHLSVRSAFIFSVFLLNNLTKSWTPSLGQRYLKLNFCMSDASLWKHSFLFAVRRWGRFARRKVYDSTTEIPYWWRKICPESGQKRWLVDGVVTLF